MKQQNHSLAINYFKIACEEEYCFIDKLTKAYLELARKLLEENQKEETVNLILEALDYYNNTLKDEEDGQYYLYTGDLYSFLYQNVENKEDWYLNAKKLYIKGEELGNEGCIIGNIVAEALTKLGKKLYYFSKNTGLEIDFVINYNN